MNNSENDTERNFRFEFTHRLPSRVQIIADMCVFQHFGFNEQMYPFFDCKTTMNEILRLFAKINWLTNNGAFELTFATLDDGDEENQDETREETMHCWLRRHVNSDGTPVILKSQFDGNRLWTHALNENEVNDILFRNPRNNEN